MSKKSRKQYQLNPPKSALSANGIKNIWEWIFFVGIILIVFLPLLNLPPLFSPPDFGKAIIFRIIVSILLFLFIVKNLLGARAAGEKDVSQAERPWFERSERARPRSEQRSPRWGDRLRAFEPAARAPLTSLAILFFVFLLATIFSQDWHNSLFDTPYRAGGSLSFFFYIFFAFLLFATIKDKKKWQKIWLAALIAGLLTCLIGIEQRFGLIRGKFIIYFGEESPSTLGGPIFFGNYILLLTFIALSFGLSSFYQTPSDAGKKTKWKAGLFYILAFLIFVFVLLFCAEKRGPIAGFLAGIFYFVFFFPFAALKKWGKFHPQTWLKIIIIIIFLFGISGLYFIKTHPEISPFSESNALSRLTRKLLYMYPSPETLADRLSSWKVAFASFKEKPILGWGPENFSVAFDKNYNPALLGLKKDIYLFSSWWDRAHNFLIDYAIYAGILGLLAFLLLIGTLFWQLQKLKHNPNLRMVSESTNNHQYKSAEISINQRVIAHGIQTTFLAYLIALSFSFDTVSTYIFFFLFVGFSLFLVRKTLIDADTTDSYRYISINPFNQYKSVFRKIKKWRYPIIACLFIVLIWFIWSLNLKPLRINKEINIAIAQSSAKNCQGAVSIMESLLKKHNFLDHYLRLKYIIILDNCIEQEPTQSMEFAKRAWEIAKENTEIRPTYIRNWIFLGGYTNMLIEAETNPEKIKELKKEADFAFEKAVEISPKKQEVYTEWIKTDLLTKDFQQADMKTKKCIELNPELWDCQWLKDLTDIYLGKHKEIDKKYAASYGSMSKENLSQMAKVFGDVKYYPPLVGIYQNVISRYEPNNPQYYASLAFVYKQLGEYDKAREQAEYILKLEPKAEADVKMFLDTLPR